MPTPPVPLNKQNKVVVARLDGLRLKGYASNFSSTRDYFRLFPAQNLPHEAGTDVDFSTLKAIFFVKDFEGHREHHDAYVVKASTHGRKIEVTFQDGEKIVGTTEAYNPQKLGFFLFPADPESNNTRVFVQCEKGVVSLKPARLLCSYVYGRAYCYGSCHNDSVTSFLLGAVEGLIGRTQ